MEYFKENVKMHTIKLNVGERAYAHLMFFLKSFKGNDIEVVEDIPLTHDESTETIDMSAYQIDAFKHMKDPLLWQQEIRAEWK